jgi:hypothetical protein
VVRFGRKPQRSKQAETYGFNPHKTFGVISVVSKSGSPLRPEPPPAGVGDLPPAYSPARPTPSPSAATAWVLSAAARIPSVLSPGLLFISSALDHHRPASAVDCCHAASALDRHRSASSLEYRRPASDLDHRRPARTIEVGRIAALKLDEQRLPSTILSLSFFSCYLLTFSDVNCPRGFWPWAENGFKPQNWSGLGRFGV